MTPLEQTFRQAGGRVVSALAASFRDLDLAEEAFAEACARAAERWSAGSPADPAAWLYYVARRCALDRVRRNATASRHHPDPADPGPTPEDEIIALDEPIPDERLRLIFICCHPAISPDAAAALTLRTVCGLSTAEVASAFLVSEATLAQRLVRAKRKIAAAGVPFDIPSADRWPDRMHAVLSTLEVAYAQAHADAALVGPHADFAVEILGLTDLLARLAPQDPEVLSFAATVRFTEARRAERLDADGAMIPLNEQDVSRWDADMCAQAEGLLASAAALGRRVRRPPGPRALQAAIHAVHADRRRTGSTEWRAVVSLYDALAQWRDDPVVLTNRAVAVAQVEGPAVALTLLDADPRPDWLPWRATRADLLARLGRRMEATIEYDSALALQPSPAEALFLAARRAASVTA